MFEVSKDSYQNLTVSLTDFVELLKVLRSFVKTTLALKEN